MNLKKQITRAAIALTAIVSMQANASFFEKCDVEAKVISVEELSVFKKGSESIARPTSTLSEDSFVQLVNIKVLSAKTDGGHTNCQHMIDENFKFILESADKKKLKADEVVKLNRSVMNGMTRYGLSYSEMWSFSK